MQRLITLLFVFQSVLGFSQVHDSLVWRYAAIDYSVGGFNSKSTVVVDYGESVQGFVHKSDVLKDENGNTIKFKTSVDALNWMGERGWELVSVSKDVEPYTKLATERYILKRLEKRTK